MSITVCQDIFTWSPKNWQQELLLSYKEDYFMAQSRTCVALLSSTVDILSLQEIWKI